jgi:hypothetical protein
VHPTTNNTRGHAATPSRITSVSFTSLAPHTSPATPEPPEGDDDPGPTKDWPSTVRQIALNLSLTLPPLLYLWIAVKQ